MKLTSADILPEMLSEAVRDGFELVIGTPEPGERVHLTPHSCPDVFHDTWVLVSTVEGAYVPRAAWVYCIDLETRQPCRRYVWPERLEVERRQPAIRS